jgi:sensor domain CHASE-containing protein
MRSTLSPMRRRKSPFPLILLALLGLVIGLVIWLASRNTEVPTQRIEQDVTNEALAG